MAFAIVKFTNEEDSVGVIPCCWINEDNKHCHYPNVTNDLKRDKLLRGGEMPDSSWPLHEISVMKTYATYSEAREKLRRAEETSDLDSDRDRTERRKRKKKDIVLPGEEELSDDETHPKKLISSRPTNSRSHPIPSHPYPSLDSFSSSSNSSDLLAQPLTFLSSSPSSRTPFSSCSQSPTPPLPVSRFTPPSHGSGSSWVNSSTRGTSVTLDSADLGRLWAALSSLAETVASQSQEMTYLHQKIDLLLARGTSRPTNETNHEEDTVPLNTFPLSSMEEFCDFEEKLKKPEFRSLVVKLLASLGGKEPKLLMYSIMKRCLTSELAMKFSYTGKPSKDQKKEKKRAFGTTVLCSTIQTAVRRIYPDTTEDQTKTHVGHWLQQAKNRIQSPRVSREESNTDDR